MKKRFIAFAMLVISVLLFGCSKEASQSQIVATTLPVYEFSTEICRGTDLKVSQLIAEDVSCLHDYTLQVHQMQLLESANVVIISGAGLDSFVEDVLTDSSLCINASMNIPLLCAESDHSHSHDHDHSDADPHIWLSPKNAKAMAENIYSGLVDIYPAHQAIFAENLQRLLEKLDQLDRYGKEQLSGINHPECITFHDGFAYLADSFDFHILQAIEEESGSEASAREIIALIDLINAHDVASIFTEKNGSASSADILHNETGTPVYMLDMAMSGSSYFDAMYHNIDTIKEAFG